MNLKGGYIIDEIFNAFINKQGIESFEDAIEEFSKVCCYELVGVEDFQLNESTENLNKQILIAYNIVNRGNPTRASGLGDISSISMPVFDRTQTPPAFLGVIGMDLLIDKLKTF